MGYSERAPHPDFGGGGERDVARGVGVLALLLRGLGAHQGGEGAGQVATQQGLLGGDVQQQGQGLRAEPGLQDLEGSRGRVVMM